VIAQVETWDGYRAVCDEHDELIADQQRTWIAAQIDAVGHNLEHHPVPPRLRKWPL